MADEDKPKAPRKRGPRKPVPPPKEGRVRNAHRGRETQKAAEGSPRRPNTPEYDGKMVPAPRQRKQPEQTEETLEMQARALRMRQAGLTYAQIAREVGYRHKSTAQRAVMRALKSEVAEAADQLRRLEATRLDTMFAAIWPRMLRGELLAIDRGLRIMERRAVMLGTDAPIRIQQHVISEELILEALEAVEAQAASLEEAGWSGDNTEDAEVVDEEGNHTAEIVQLREVSDGTEDDAGMGDDPPSPS
jgi:hypothetical protein